MDLGLEAHAVKSQVPSRMVQRPEAQMKTNMALVRALSPSASCAADNSR
jgi:hypothetical protein